MQHCTAINVRQSPGAMMRDGIVLFLRGAMAGIASLRRGLDERRAIRDLKALDDRLLRDIGLRPGDIDTLFKD